MTTELREPGELQVERLPTGKRQLLRPLIVEIEGKEFRVPTGFETDYSSWPALAAAAVLATALAFQFLQPSWAWAVAIVVGVVGIFTPRWSQIDVAGVVHDYAFQHATFGKDGRKVGFVEANRLWFLVARAGEHRASGPGSWIGRAGLFVGSGPVWWGYRRKKK